jgi:hypothetical protein
MVVACGHDPALVPFPPCLSALEIVVLREGKRGDFSSSSSRTCSRRLWGLRPRRLGSDVMVWYFSKWLDCSCTSRDLNEKNALFYMLGFLFVPFASP